MSSNLFRRIGIFALDVIFVFAWLGFATVIVWLARSFLIGLTSGITQREFLMGYGQQIFRWTAVLWTGLTGLMFVSCYGNARLVDFKSNLWTRILITNFFIVGPTAYYISSFRPRAIGKAGNNFATLLKRSRPFLDVLYFLSFWCSVGFLFSGVGVLFAFSLESFTFLATIMILLLPFAAIPSIVLLVILLMDAVERPEEQWEEINFLKLLNPFSWLFGMRKYYLQILRPEL